MIAGEGPSGSHFGVSACLEWRSFEAFEVCPFLAKTFILVCLRPFLNKSDHLMLLFFNLNIYVTPPYEFTIRMAAIVFLLIMIGFMSSFAQHVQSNTTLLLNNRYTRIVLPQNGPGFI